MNGDLPSMGIPFSFSLSLSLPSFFCPLVVLASLIVPEAKTTVAVGVKEEEEVEKEGESSYSVGRNFSSSSPASKTGFLSFLSLSPSLSFCRTIHTYLYCTRCTPGGGETRECNPAFPLPLLLAFFCFFLLDMTIPVFSAESITSLPDSEQEVHLF